jgi:hypothetical protein
MHKRLDYRNALRFWLAALLTAALFSPRAGLAGHSNDDQRVNRHLAETNTKLQLDREKASLENEKIAPNFDRTPTYEDPKTYRSYGVDMQPEHLPFDDLDLDHLDQEPLNSL